MRPSRMSRLTAAAVAVVVAVSACSSGADVYAAARSPSGMTIRLDVRTCNADLSVEVEETPDRVTVSVTALNDTNDDCSDGLVFNLSEPLGERPLVDASDGRVIEVRIKELLEDANG